MQGVLVRLRNALGTFEDTQVMTHIDPFLPCSHKTYLFRVPTTLLVGGRDLTSVENYTGFTLLSNLYINFTHIYVS